MSNADIDWHSVLQNERFQRLARRRRNLVLVLGALAAAYYFAIPALIAWASVVYRHTTQDGNHATGATLGEDYFLSKRTALYVRGSLIKIGPHSAMTINSAASSPLPKPGVTVTDLAVGIYHNF
jgi:uncharacterized membrane protein (DUF485 family)